LKRQFSLAQSRAINHYTGPCLVLAGPGSGKTTVITHRTKNLIEQFGVNPFNILVITFTKAAALEMQERFEKLMEGQSVPVSFGTFHAIFFKILKYAYNYSAQNIIREEEKYRLIKSFIEDENLEIEDEKEFVNSLIAEIGNVKGDMIDVNNYYSGNCSDEIFRRIYNRYEEKLRMSNMVDFDDMMVMCYELFVARPDILEAWQKKYEFILIDEFQDINRIQYEIIKMLAKPQNNLFIVGDDDQSIYRFRGARPEIMLNFERDYVDTEKIVLDENYRSTENIINASQRLIKNNKQRFSKDIKSVNGKGNNVEYLEFKSPKEENMRIVDDIIKNVKSGKNYSDIAVLFRTNIGPRLLVDKLMEYNIPFHMKDAMPNIYEHFIAKDIIAYIKIAMGESKREHYLRIINRPKRYIGREIFDNTDVNLQDIRMKSSDKKWLVDKVDKLEYDLTMLKRMSPYAAINYIRQGIGYDKFIDEYAKFRKMNVEELYEVANELMELSKDYKSYEEWFQYIDEYSEELVNQAKQNRKLENAVELYTMHGAKGLEYEIVYVVDAVEGVTPHNKAVLDEDIEEERRLFYVALTRAKKELHIFWVKERFNKPVEMSRFVREMMVDYDEISEGMTVIHKRYGKGIIRLVDSGKAVIYFERVRKEMVFDIKYAFGNRILECERNS
jgi:DNA helicase-2/ATP-dependent DNA helicase PcrA